MALDADVDDAGDFINSLVAASGGATPRAATQRHGAAETHHRSSLKTPEEVLDFHIATLADSHLAETAHIALDHADAGRDDRAEPDAGQWWRQLSALRLRETLYTMMSCPNTR